MTWQPDNQGPGEKIIDLCHQYGLQIFPHPGRLYCMQSYGYATICCLCKSRETRVADSLYILPYQLDVVIFS